MDAMWFRVVSGCSSFYRIVRLKSGYSFLVVCTVRSNDCFESISRCAAIMFAMLICDLFGLYFAPSAVREAVPLAMKLAELYAFARFGAWLFVDEAPYMSLISLISLRSGLLCFPAI